MKSTHSVDSVASYSSQNHVDRIRNKHFSSYSGRDDDELQSKQNKFKQQRSLSNLEFTYTKRPESVISNTSSTRSRLRDFVERKTQDDQKSSDNKTADIEYFENPTETLEFNNQRTNSKKAQGDKGGKKRLSRTSKESKCYSDPIEIKPRKHEKYQSKLAEYYNLPKQLPQDEFYQHLTRSRASSEGIIDRRLTKSSSDAEFNAILANICKQNEPEGSNLRRSRSLAVIREETFTDLQLQGHSKNKRSQLIPRARLFDKPSFKDRLPVKAKHQTKEEALERIYSRSTNSSFTDNTIVSEDRCNKVIVPSTEEIYKDAKSITVPKLKGNQLSVGESWPNIADLQNISKSFRELSEDSINYSRNPSEIDSLDSNYVCKHYNFEANNRTPNYEESSPEDTERLTSALDEQLGKTLFIYEDDNTEPEKVNSADIGLPNYFHDHKYDTDKSLSNDSVSVPNSDKSHTDFTVLDREIHDDDLDSYDEVSVNDKLTEKETSINTQTITKSTSTRDQNESRSAADTRSVESEHDDTISTPPDSITSYVSLSIPSSIEKSRKLENLANSLAEKIDEYCETKFSNITLKKLGDTYKTQSDISSIYTKIRKPKTQLGPTELKAAEHLNHQKSLNESQLYTQYHNKYISHQSVAPETDDFKTRSLYRQSSSSKNITTEPYVTTLIENQYYSLPDINISKSLRKSERIDAKLREEDPEDLHSENAYEIANSLIEENSVEKTLDSVKYGHLTVSNYTSNKINQNNPDVNTTPVFISENNNDITIQNITIITDISEQPTPSSTLGKTSVVTVDGVIIEVEKIKKSLTIKREEDKTKKSQKDYIGAPHLEQKDKEFPSNTQKPYLTESSSSVILPSVSTSVSANEPKSINVEAKPNTGIKKHYSLRQRDPKGQEEESLPTPDTTEHKHIKTTDPPVINLDKNTKPHSSVIACIAPYNKSIDANIAIVPLGGHQTLVIDPPIVKIIENKGLNDHRKELKTHIKLEYGKGTSITQKINEPNDKLTIFETTHVEQPVKATVTKVKKETSEKIAAVQHKFEKPPSRLIIKDNKKIPSKLVLRTSNMTRPQILHVVHGRQVFKSTQETNNKIKTENNITEGKIEKVNQEKVSIVKNDIPYKTKLEKLEHAQVNDKINRVIKTDLEYQEKLHSVKNYWSKLIDKTKESTEGDQASRISSNKDSIHTVSIQETPAVQNKEVSNVCNLIQSIETVKIVDSIKKSNSDIEIWKNETEKVKDDSEMEESTLKKIVKEYDDRNNALSSSICNNSMTTTAGSECNTLSRTSPDIEIVELGSDDNNEKTHATLIKSKSYNKDCTDFDHVRYKVMKSELFRNSMIANYRKEAQFDGLLQYLQDYSFQELLVKNHIVIIEPVRTKIEPKTVVSKNTTKPTSYRINPTTLNKEEKSDENEKAKSKSGIRRHFFYHPIRINKEIIEEELPNPDTVKKVRNLFEDTLKMRSPDNSSDHSIAKQSKINVSNISDSYKNLADDSDTSKNGTRKKVMRYLTIDTSYGNKKWDSASLSSGVSSGDLSSNNDQDYVSDNFSPILKRNHRNTIYSSSSEEYLYESLNHGLYESQYVSQEILRKIRDCGTSITYYGGKVLDKRAAPAVSPMTKAIMEEIRGLQKNCSRDCVSCQNKCHGGKCVCLNTELSHKDSLISRDKNRCSCNSSDSGNQELTKPSLVDRNSDGYIGIKFKLVKSNSCSSRLELSGTDDMKNPRLRFRNKRQSLDEKRSSIDDPPIIYDVENSVKNKICRIESYKKGIASSPFNEKKKVSLRLSENNLANMEEESLKDGNYSEASENTTTGKSCSTDSTDTVRSEVMKGDAISSPLNDVTNESQSKTSDACEVSDDTDKDDVTKNSTDKIFDKKYYYVNDNKNGGSGKFGEMIFEEFEVLESCYDSLNSTRSNVK